MLKKVQCLLIVILIVFSFNSCGQDSLTNYCNNLKEVKEEWGNFKGANIKGYSDIGFLKVWH